MTTEWDHSMRCPHCGGLNDLAAEWCMQCSRRLVPQREEIDLNAGTPTAREIVGGGLDMIAGDVHEGSDEGIEGAFAVEGGAVTWTCGRCAHRNPIEATVCEACGRSFVESARVIADAELPKKRFHSSLKAFGILLGGAVVMRLVAGLISPWAAAGLLAGAVIRGVVRFFRA